ncbi:hypothetical protein [Chondromyces crocatus]|nr:hypothetical protein [Chondromyces crocatus]
MDSSILRSTFLPCDAPTLRFELILELNHLGTKVGCSSLVDGEASIEICLPLFDVSQSSVHSGAASEQ